MVTGVDGTILLWDIFTGELLGQLKGHKDTIYSLAYSRDGTCLASGGCAVVYLTLDL